MSISKLIPAQSEPHIQLTPARAPQRATTQALFRVPGVAGAQPELDTQITRDRHGKIVDLYVNQLLRLL